MGNSSQVKISKYQPILEISPQRKRFLRRAFCARVFLFSCRDLWKLKVFVTKSSNSALSSAGFLSLGGDFFLCTGISYFTREMHCYGGDLLLVTVKPSINLCKMLILCRILVFIKQSSTISGAESLRAQN